MGEQIGADERKQEKSDSETRTYWTGLLFLPQKFLGFLFGNVFNQGNKNMSEMQNISPLSIPTFKNCSLIESTGNS